MNTDRHSSEERLEDTKTGVVHMHLWHTVRKVSVLICVHLWLFLLLIALTTMAQVRPVNDYGAMGLGQLLKRLQTTGSVMMIGAHPDDEDSALLAYLARGENARTAYLSLTRGDGGQNIIGPELFEPLGVIRTEELLQARRLDGAEQYFTRAFDYGFSKTLAEAKAKWPEDVIKCDVVRSIRLFRPLVVISRFTGTPQDGHGQHQYAGYITPIAVKAAADPAQCAEAGEPWTVKKFYIESGFQDNSEPTLKINTGQYDPILGRTYFEIAMEGRSLHRSQGEGRIEFHGDVFSGLNLAGAAKDVHEKGIFDGLPPNAPIPLSFGVQVRNPDLTRPATLIAGLAATVEAAGKYAAAMSDPVAKEQGLETQSEAVAGLRIASGIQIDALADAETIVPGGELMVSVKAFEPKRSPIKIGSISLTARENWTITKTDPPKQNNAAYNSRETADAAAVFSVHVAPDAPTTQPYWLRTRRKTDLFDWRNTPWQTLPFDPPLLLAHVTANISGTDVTFDQPVQYRFADPSRGEIRREINVVPPVSVSVDRDLLIVPESDKAQTRHIVVHVTNNSSREESGMVGLDSSGTPPWKVDPPAGGKFDLKSKGATVSIPLELTIPALLKARTVSIRAIAVIGDFENFMSMNTVAYPHIQTHRYYTPAEVNVLVLDLKTAPVNVGYIMGSGDEVPNAIRQIGMNVTMLGEQDLASGDLSKFDTIVVGIRATETRPDFVANNSRLLDYVRNGGNMIVQYQRGNWTGIAPYPVNTQDKQGTTAGSINRVVDENAKVTILDPADPVFNSPNKITDADFADWVQERNAYNLVTFDPQYKPLLESHDAGEQENKGGLVVAKVGKGTWMYCSYSFFRQLPAGVPGAYRLFANLLASSKAEK
jgi:LmbE family N-acetylglucosaminyl deacetylase